jgi:hypothetical protein
MVGQMVGPAQLMACLLICEFIAKGHLKARCARLTLAWSRAVESGGGKSRGDEVKDHGDQKKKQLHVVGTVDAVA